MNRNWTGLAEACRYAFEIHAGQRRKGGDIPYISHLMAVSALVLEHGGDEDLAIAGLLHDAIEDCAIEHEAIIGQRFGPRVARIVRALTDADVKPKPAWRPRKAAYLGHLESADQDVLLVSCADKLHNATSILLDVRAQGLAAFDRFSVPRAETMWYYRSLSDLFSRRLHNPIAARLHEAVGHLQAVIESLEPAAA